MKWLSRRSKAPFFEWLSWQKWLPKRLVYYLSMKLLAVVSTTTFSNRHPDSIGFMEALHAYEEQNDIYGRLKRQAANESRC